jgi:hypothetical protein
MRVHLSNRFILKARNEIEDNSGIHGICLLGLSVYLRGQNLRTFFIYLIKVDPSGRAVARITSSNPGEIVEVRLLCCVLGRPDACVSRCV